jgi:hypothetical protein
MEMRLKPKTKNLGRGLNRLPITMNSGGRGFETADTADNVCLAVQY